MLFINRIRNSLRNKSGISMLFVIGIMTLLLTIGASVLTAASSNIGSNVRQNAYNRAVVLNDSIQRNIQHGLMGIDQETAAFDDSLALQILNYIFEKYDGLNPDDKEKPHVSLEIDEELSLLIDIIPTGTDYTIIIDFTPPLGMSGIQISNVGPFYLPPEIEPDPDKARIPKTMTIETARITVTVTVPINTFGERHITSTAVYGLNGVVFSDENSPGTAGTPGTLELTDEKGNWELISYDVGE